MKIQNRTLKGGEKMEKRLIKKMEALSDEELLKNIQKGGKLGKETAEKGLQRGGVSGKHLCSVLESIKPTSLDKEEVAKIKTRAEKILIEKFLDEKSFLTILNEGSPIGKRNATKKYCSENKDISNYLLRKILERVPAYRVWAAKKLRSQNPTDEDYLAIIEELEGVDPEFQSETLEMFLEEEISLDDASYLMGFVKSSAARVWKEIHQKGKLEEFSREHLKEIRLSDHPKIREWAIRKLDQKLKERKKELLEKKEANLREIEHLRQLNEWGLIQEILTENTRIKWELSDINNEIEKLKGELQKNCFQNKKTLTA